MSDAQTKILDAASVLFLQGGVPALSVRSIAREAGISTIGIYSHFNGKQGILDALYIEGFGFVYDAMEQHMVGLDKDAEQGAETIKQNVLNACAAYMDVGAEHEAHYRLIFGERDASYLPSADAQAAANRAFAKLVSVAGAYVGETSSFELKQKIALDTWAIVHGYVSISHHVAMANQTIDWKQQALEAVARLLSGY